MSTITGTYFDVYKGHHILLEKDDYEADWYIQVRGPNGCYCYDGPWHGSENKSLEEAIAEAKYGAEIDDKDPTP